MVITCLGINEVKLLITIIKVDKTPFKHFISVDRYNNNEHSLCINLLFKFYSIDKLDNFHFLEIILDTTSLSQNSIVNY